MKALLVLTLLYSGVPDAWQPALLLSHDVQGLRMYTWQLQADDEQIVRWRSTHRPRCTRISPQWAPEWHCLSENFLYSLLRGEAGYLWVQSERLAHEVALDLPFHAEVVSQYHNDQEQVSVLQTRQPLYELQARLLRQPQHRDRKVLMHEQNDAGFIVQWAEGGHLEGAAHVTLTAQRDPDGLVQLVYTRILAQGGAANIFGAMKQEATQ